MNPKKKNFFKYRDGAKFLDETGLTPKEAIEYLDEELSRRKKVIPRE